MTAPTIISTKINPPRLHTDVVMRPRVLDMFQSGLARRSALMLISAPAGYGKTTFVRSALQAIEQPCAWLSLEPDDDTLSRFLTYLISALQAIQPSIGKSTLMLLEGLQPPQNDALLSSLIYDLAKFPACVLVLDDYHLITSVEIHAFVASLIEHAQPHLQLIITTRTDPPLPLAKWRARNLLTEIRAADLQFTLPEATEFLQRSMHVDLSPQHVRHLEERTEGWVAGLQLAALSIRNQQTAPQAWSLAGDQRDIADYLMAEVLGQLSNERRDFLLQTSILSRMSASVCNAVTEREDSQAMLEALEADNLFTVPLDESRTWFRYHHLFAEFLHKCLRAEYSSAQVNALHQRASHWLAEKRFIPQAIDHALAAQDFAYAAHLLGPQAEAWMRHGEVRTILKYLRQLPNELVWAQWGLCMWYGWACALTGDLPVATRWTTRLDELITPLIQQAAQQESGPVPIGLQNAYVQALAIRSIIARTEKDFATAIALAEQALRLVPQDNPYLKTIFSALLSSATLAAGQFDDTESILRSARPAAYRIGNPFIVFTMLMDGSALAMMRGQLHRAHELNLEALQLTQSAGMERLAFVPQIRLGRVHYFWNQLAQSREYIAVALANVNAAESPVTATLGTMTQALIEQAEGDTEQALQTLQTAEAIASQHHQAEMVERVKGLRAQIQLSVKDEAARRWLKSSGWESFHPAPAGPIFNDESFFACCRLLIESHDPKAWQRVERLLAWRLADSERQSRNSTIITIRLMQALLHQTRQENEQALAVLLQALELAAPELCIRPFLDEGAALLPFLKRVPQKHALKNFAQKILASQLNHVHTKSTLLEPLSEQELKILQLMAHGHSNPEIARTLVLAVSTVRWYAKQIFRKLGVHNRTQAATQARKLNLL